MLFLRCASAADKLFAITGLVPVIQQYVQCLRLDARDKPGHDRKWRLSLRRRAGLPARNGSTLGAEGMAVIERAVARPKARRGADGF